MNTVPETASGLVLTETSQLVDAKAVVKHFPKRYFYRPDKPGEKERQEKYVREDRARLQARNREIQKIGREDPNTDRVAKEQVVSLGENRSPGQAWTHLVDEHESLVACQNLTEMRQQFSQVLPAFRRFPEEVLIGNAEFPNTLSRLRLVDLENQNGTDIAVVIPNLQRDHLALHYTGERPANVEPGAPVVIDTTQVRPDEMLRRSNGERIFLDEIGKPADLAKIPLDEHTQMWVVTQIPEKAIIAVPD
jgi:hypothetical protein